MKRDSMNGMQSAVYDTDLDGIVDKAGAVRDVDDLPGSPTAGELVSKDGKLYHASES
jgi:hypothetical protein